MRITDVVTPQELKQIFEREYNDVAHMGHRKDLQMNYLKALTRRLSVEYIMVLDSFVGPNLDASGMMRLLALLDRFLEEKYDSNKPTN